MSGARIPEALVRDTASGVKLAKVPDPTYPDRPNRAAALVCELLDAGRLPRLVAVWGKRLADNQGDCSDVAIALLLDLCRAGKDKAWRMVEGEVQFNPDRVPMYHAWLEYDGWAVDASNGDRQPVILMRSRAYRALGHAKIERIRSARQWLADQRD